MLLLLGILSLLSLAYSKPASCGKDEDCRSVTENENFVRCIQGTCVCLSENGFVGQASPDSKCSCPLPGKFIFAKPGEPPFKEDLRRSGSHDVPYCVDLPGALKALRDVKREEKLMGIIHDLYTDLQWPIPHTIMMEMVTGNYTHRLWSRVASNAIGRVDPVGNFEGQDGVIEYFVGTLWTGISKVPSLVFTKLLSRDNWVASSVDMFFNSYDVAQENVIGKWNYTQSGFFTFNDQDQIQSMDLIIHYLGYAPAPYPVTIETTCHAILNVAKCDASHDPAGFYSDMADCIAFMNSIPMGNYDNVQQNTVTCRSFHSVLAIARPEIHCPHSGKTGIGMLHGHPHHVCTYHPYDEYYDIQY